MITELVQGKMYNVPFISPYTSKGPYNIEVSAIAKKSTLEIYGDFDIRGTFFDEVGIKTYLTMVTDETEIYICHEITSYDPPEVDTGSFIFIPKSIIDFNSVEEYESMTRYTFVIEGVRRHFDTSYENKQFIKDLESSIPDAVMEKTQLANDVLSISNTQEDLIVRSSVIAKEEEDRQAYINLRENNIREMKKAETERENDYYKRINAVKKREDAVTIKEKTVEVNLKKAETLKSIGNAFLKFTNDFLERMHSAYLIVLEQSKEVGTTIPAWNELTAKIFNTLSNGDDISLAMWKEYLEEFNTSGTWPDALKNLDESKCPLCGTTTSELTENIK